MRLHYLKGLCGILLILAPLFSSAQSPTTDNGTVHFIRIRDIAASELISDHTKPEELSLFIPDFYLGKENEKSYVKGFLINNTSDTIDIHLLDEYIGISVDVRYQEEWILLKKPFTRCYVPFMPSVVKLSPKSYLRFHYFDAQSLDKVSQFRFRHFITEGDTIRSNSVVRK